jgi:hypothetical protein
MGADKARPTVILKLQLGESFQEWKTGTAQLFLSSGGEHEEVKPARVHKKDYGRGMGCRELYHIFLEKPPTP